MTAGRHRATGPLPTIDLAPETRWHTATPPADPAPDREDHTGSFTLADVANAAGRLPDALMGPDPTPTGPLPMWSTGEIPVIRERPATPEPTSWWALLGAVALVILFGVVLVALALAPGGA